MGLEITVLSEIIQEEKEIHMISHIDSKKANTEK
jgi:hypothetical protein